MVAAAGGCSEDETALEPDNGTPQDGLAVRLVSWDALMGEGAVRIAPVGVAEVQFAISSPAMQTIEKTTQVGRWPSDRVSKRHG